MPLAELLGCAEPRLKNTNIQIENKQREEFKGGLLVLEEHTGGPPILVWGLINEYLVEQSLN